MRRVILPVLFLLLGAGAVRAQDSPTLLGSSGEVYRVLRGAYRDLFPAAPAGGQAANPVLALEVTRDGRSLRTLVPGTEGPGPEQAAALAADGNRVYLLWGDGRDVTVSGWTAAGWDAPFALELDATSSKVNPQMVATSDRFPVVGADGRAAEVQRTILHLVWLDRGPGGDRLLYTAVVSQDGELQRSNQVVELEPLAGQAGPMAPAGPPPMTLVQHPQLRPGRDGKSVLVGLVSRDDGALATLELRPVGGDIVSFADHARAVIIETGRNNPGSSRVQLADLARAVIIETGHTLFKTSAAKVIEGTFIDSIAGSSEEVELAAAAESAARAAIGEGASLLTLPEKDDADTELVELAGPDAGDAGRQVLDARPALRRALPSLPPDADVRLFLSADGDAASLAWAGTGYVRYRESTANGWSVVHTLALGPAFTKEAAFALVQQRLNSK